MRRFLAGLLTALAIFLAAFAAGLALSSDLGEEQIRREAERQLSGLLHTRVEIRRVRLGLGLGLVLEGTDTTAWPTAEGPILGVDRVTATVSLGALATGRFRLRHLELRGARFRIERLGHDRWSEPIQGVLDEQAEDPPETNEPGLGMLRALHGATLFLLRESEIAPRVDVADATLVFADALPTGARAAPLRLRFEHLHGSVERHWFGDTELRVDADLVGRGGRPSRVELQGRSENEERLTLTLAVTDAPLVLFEPYARAVRPDATLGGDASGVVLYDANGSRTSLELDWLVHDLRTAVPRPEVRTLVPVATDRAKLRAVFELDPLTLRLRHGRLAGGGLELDLSGAMRRPLSARSPTRLSLSLDDLGLPGLRSVLGWLPDAVRDDLAPALDRVEAGRVARLGLRGSGRLSDWGRLPGGGGGLAGLPHGFALHARLADLTVRVGDDARLQGLRGDLEWSEDTLEARDVTATWNGAPLPTLSARVAGVSALLAAGPAQRALPPNDAGTLPGLAAARDLLSAEGGEEATPAPPLRVQVDHLEHPAALWPLDDLDLAVEPVESGFRVDVAEGRWAGVPLRGEALWTTDPAEHLGVRLQLGNDLPGPPGPPPRRAGAATRSDWASGRFEIGPLDAGPGDARSYRGRFQLEGDRLRLADLEAPTQPTGVLRAKGSVDLSRPGQVGIDVRFAWTGADVDAVLERFGRTGHFASGSVDLDGSLVGTLSPQHAPLEDLQGMVSVDARQGEIKWRLPLLAAIAGAGQNVFGSHESVRYDTVHGVVALSNGTLRTDAFALDGPDLRMAGRGKVDILNPPYDLNAFVGVSVLRPIDAVVEKLPLVNLLRGRDGYLVGAYFAVSGPWDHPRARLSPLRGLTGDLIGFLEWTTRRGS